MALRKKIINKIINTNFKSNFKRSAPKSKDYEESNIIRTGGDDDGRM
jgi:hypothetical protein